MLGVCVVGVGAALVLGVGSLVVLHYWSQAVGVLLVNSSVKWYINVFMCLYHNL